MTATDDLADDLGTDPELLEEAILEVSREDREEVWRRTIHQLKDASQSGDSE